jgi:polyhydroxyalkanoate synthesis regulator phasin
MGLTEVTAAKARELVSSLLTQGISLSTRAPEVLGQVQAMADDLMSTGKDNREMLVGLVRSEVDRTVARMGFVREDELAALRRQVEKLQQEVRQAAQSATTPPSAKSETGTAAGPGPDSQSPPKPAARKKKVVIAPEGSE